MNTDFNTNGTGDAGASIQLSEQRTGEDRRQVDRRVCDRRELCVDGTNSPNQNRRSSDRRDTERRGIESARRTQDVAAPPLGYELRLEPRGPGGTRKASEITTTITVPVAQLRENCTATVDRMAREFHTEVIEHFRRNLPRVQLLRATVDCIQPPTDLSAYDPDATVELTLRAICLCRRKPDSARKAAAS